MEMDPGTQHIVILVVLILVAGFAGGLANYFRRERGDDAMHPFAKPLVMGVCAAFLVPLFLEMTSSDILKVASGLNYLIFLGFCLVASLSSRAFIENISQRVIQAAERAEAEVSSLRSDVDPIILKETELPEADAPLSEEVLKDEMLQRVIVALGNPNYSWRFESGMAQETRESREQVREVLDRLVSDGYATHSMKQGRDAWALKLSGRQLLRQIQSR